MNRLSKLNMLVESKQIDLIMESPATGLASYFEKHWSLEDEFVTMLPFMFKKLDFAFSNFFGTDAPGQLELDQAEDNPDIEPIDVGSPTPGFEASWEMNTDYLSGSVFPCLLKTEYGQKLNNKLNLTDPSTDISAHLIIRLNAEHTDLGLDLAKPNLKIPKFSISKWEGNVYLNFDGIGDGSNYVAMGTITLTVKVKEYKDLLDRLHDFLNSLGKEKVKKDGLNNSIRCGDQQYISVDVMMGQIMLDGKRSKENHYLEILEKYQVQKFYVLLKWIKNGKKILQYN